MRERERERPQRYKLFSKIVTQLDEHCAGLQISSFLFFDEICTQTDFVIIKFSRIQKIPSARDLLSSEWHEETSTPEEQGWHDAEASLVKFYALI